MEPNKTAHNKRKQRTREEIIRLLQDYENSGGLSVREYSDMIGVNDATFYNWRKKYGVVQEPQVNFIPLEVTGIQKPAASLQAEVKVIKFYGPLCLEQLKALLS
jgi:transposase-like protein